MTIDEARELFACSRKPRAFHWKGRACKGYTRVGGQWLLVFHTGLLEYAGTKGPPFTRGGSP